jgi:low temperature requirement protein LtrA
MPTFSVLTYGYVIMRVALLAQWLRAAHDDPDRRTTSLRFATGITLVQIGWLCRLALPDRWAMPSFFVLLLADVLVPVMAERAGRTQWHPQHIAERYGLFTIIVLGESILAATLAFQSALDAGRDDASLISLAAAALVIVFSMWWLYFDRPAGGLLTSLPWAIFWGYGHYFVFASAAAVGAGIAVGIDYKTHVGHLSKVAGGYAIAVPVAVYLLSVWALHFSPGRGSTLTVAFPVAAVLVLAAPWLPAPVQVTAVWLATLVAVTLIAGRRRPFHRVAGRRPAHSSSQPSGHPPLA